MQNNSDKTGKLGQKNTIWQTMHQ